MDAVCSTFYILSLTEPNIGTATNWSLHKLEDGEKNHKKPNILLDS